MKTGAILRTFFSGLFSHLFAKHIPNLCCFMNPEPSPHHHLLYQDPDTFQSLFKPQIKSSWRKLRFESLPFSPAASFILCLLIPSSSISPFTEQPTKVAAWLTRLNSNSDSGINPESCSRAPEVWGTTVADVWPWFAVRRENSRAHTA